MENTEINKQAGRRTEKHKVPDNLPSLYANFANVAVSLMDVKLRFGILQESTAEELVIRDVAEVFMSPQHAKALSILLAGRIKLYEEKFGPLPDVREAITTDGQE